MKKHAGFTLIELIIVIVILGILGALVVPRFASFDKQARLSSLNSLQGAVWSAASIAHAQAIMDNQTGASGKVTIEGQEVSLVYGYPAQAAGGIDSALSNMSGFSYSGGKFDFATPRTYCFLTYTESTGANILPSIVPTNSGC